MKFTDRDLRSLKAKNERYIAWKSTKYYQDIIHVKHSENSFVPLMTHAFKTARVSKSTPVNIGIRKQMLLTLEMT